MKWRTITLNISNFGMKRSQQKALDTTIENVMPMHAWSQFLVNLAI